MVGVEIAAHEAAGALERAPVLDLPAVLPDGPHSLRLRDVVADHNRAACHASGRSAVALRASTTRSLIDVRTAIRSELGTTAEPRAARCATAMGSLVRDAATADLLAVVGLAAVDDDDAAARAAAAADRGDASAVGAWLAVRPSVAGIQAAALRLVDATAADAIRADVARLVPVLRAVDAALHQLGHAAGPSDYAPPGLPAALRGLWEVRQ